VDIIGIELTAKKELQESLCCTNLGLYSYEEFHMSKEF